MKYKNTVYFIILIILGILYLLLGDIFNLYIPCIFHKLTNLYCPGCGMTRALRSLIMGDFYQAFRYNNLIYLILFVFIIYYGEKILNKLKIKNFNLSKYMNNVFWISLLIVVICYGILRNIAYFNYLIPTKI